MLGLALGIGLKQSPASLVRWLALGACCLRDLVQGRGREARSDTSRMQLWLAKGDFSDLPFVGSTRVGEVCEWLGGLLSTSATGESVIVASQREAFVDELFADTCFANQLFLCT